MSPLHEIADRLRRASRITVLTGAGVSAASGVPTFRGAGGLWSARHGSGGRGYRAEELATAAAFARDARLVWEWYAWRRELIAACAPNAAHDVIAAWSQRWPFDAAQGRPFDAAQGRPFDTAQGRPFDSAQGRPFDAAQGRPGCRVITQNVDDLHVRAGTRELVRLHGSIWELSCWRTCQGPGWRWRDERVPLPALPPSCPACGGLARPAVVWFGESLDPRDLDAADAAATCDVFLTVGTSAIVYPAAGFVHEARRRGAFTVEINLESTTSSAAVDIAVQGPAETTLPEIERLLMGG